jgi:LDH2 family malate/lactate/ureidoglycolate dehydrogenase
MQDCIQRSTDEGKGAAMGDQRYSPEGLRDFGSHVLESLGVPATDAALVADSLVQADLWGHGSHGMLRLPWYAARLRSGAMNAVTEPVALADTGSLVLLDGRDGIGQVLAERARVLAVDRAKAHGVGAIGVRNSNHFGTAMWFTRRAARDGCVAVLTTNASPAMAPWGGRQKVLGTNPWSIAAPAPGGKVVAVDIANTAVARGKIYLAKNRGEPIPDSWALTADGAPTTDPAEGVLGVVLPMAGHKGYAITFLMDVLSGALTGSGVGTEVHGPYEPEARSRAGHLFLAIDPTALGDPADYEARVQQLIDEVKGVPLAQGFDEVFYPGEVEDRAEAANRAAGGVVLAAESVLELRRLGEETGVDFAGVRQ